MQPNHKLDSGQFEQPADSRENQSRLTNSANCWPSWYDAVSFTGILKDKLMTVRTRKISAMGILLALLCGVIHHVSGKTVRGTEPVPVLKNQATAKPKPAAIDFEKQIAPLLAKRCLECHSGSKPKGGLNLTRRKLSVNGSR